MKRRAKGSLGRWSQLANRAVCLGLMTVGLTVGVVWATHEADHRFTVEGFVCEFDGTPAKKTEVVVKDTRVNVGQTVETDERGFYRATLHLHNDNLGDPVLVTARREEQRIKVEFDPNDLESERKARVGFGTGCERAAPDEVPGWVWYTLAGLGVGTALLMAGKLMRSQRRAERAKGHKKQRR